MVVAVSTEDCSDRTTTGEQNEALQATEDPSAVVDETHCSAPLDRWDFPLPLAISQTCNRFRTIAVATPMLWSRITIYREPRVSGCKSEMGNSPQRWNQARLWLTRATRTFIKCDGSLRSGIDKGFLDVRIFAAMYTSDGWDEPVINERWFGGNDMDEVGLFYFAYSVWLTQTDCFLDMRIHFALCAASPILHTLCG